MKQKQELTDSVGLSYFPKKNYYFILYLFISFLILFYLLITFLRSI
ncbi:hypothetical protein DDB_G0270620 [Dictyostelium discoideum AX4]|uniref:Uncharacterized protein n=1 Tax=Dictyostelium discoideum TaxID=44689 RepID=Q55DC4_DICDI|nr:hypothetical protein DDB_G0270620 [Dictyostelium discoideum AX4]EAL72660.1 hypothetical protein DDB_G0270620 [Dictyostelium discoideum AX4]|eukprot:XP_646207.1 hypothetical protein DDB_G0270620 [Dictyostelium discoideum AX4]